jgi:hypothetical protein
VQDWWGMPIAGRDRCLSDIASLPGFFSPSFGDVGSSRSFVTEAANVLCRETKIEPSVVARPRGARGSDFTARPQASSDRLRALLDLHPATARLRPSPYQTTFVPPNRPSQSHRIAAVRLHPRIQLAQSVLSSRLPEGNFRCSPQDTGKRRAHPLANPQAGEE